MLRVHNRWNDDLIYYLPFGENDTKELHVALENLLPRRFSQTWRFSYSNGQDNKRGKIVRKSIDLHKAVA